MSFYCVTDVFTSPAPVKTPAPLAPCDTFTPEGCYVDDRDDRIMGTRIVRSPMSAEVRIQLSQCPGEASGSGRRSPEF